MSYGSRPEFVSWSQPRSFGSFTSTDFWCDLFVRGEPRTPFVVWPIVVTIGCECGLEAHPGESCEGALACVEAMCEGCTCGGYWNADTRTVEHDGFCDLVPSPESCECGFTWVHADGCEHDGEPPRWRECSCGLGCSWGNGCLRARRSGASLEDEHDGAHVFAGPCEAAV